MYLSLPELPLEMWELPWLTTSCILYGNYHGWLLTPNFYKMEVRFSGNYDRQLGSHQET